MNAAQLMLDFGLLAGSADRVANQPIVAPEGFRLLRADEMKQEGDMFWSEYMHEYLPELPPWSEIIVLTEFNGGLVGEEAVIRRIDERNERNGHGNG